MATLPDPFALLTTSQRVALTVVRESWSRLHAVTVAGVTRPEDAVREIGVLLSSVGELAGATTRPLQEFIARQRQLADTLANLADAQAELSRLVATLAHHHAQTVEALEALTAPVLGLSDLVDKPAGSAKKRPR